MKSNIIKIDLDYIPKKSFKSYKFNTFIFLFIKIFVNLWNYRGIFVENIKVYETRKGFHILITLNKEISIYEILLIQSILGDSVREAYNYSRLLAKNFKNFNFFSQMKRKVRYHIEDGKVIKKEVIYESEERITKKSNKLLRKLLKIMDKIKKGYFKQHLGEFF